MKYVVYARKSTDTEDKQVLSLESQVAELKEIAQKEDLQIVCVLEESRSAKDPGRPIFNQMIEMITRGEADAILCWKIDRLTRNPVDGGQIQWLLQKGLIGCIKTFEKDYYPSDNVLLMSIEQAMATQYVRDLGVLVKRGNRAKLARGEWPNHAPMGYINDKATKLVKIDKKYAQYIERTYQLYGTGGYTLNQIVEILYKEGLRTSRGTKVRKNQIHRFLMNPFYYGIMERDGKFYEGKHKPIVTKKMFDLAQDVLHGRLHPRPKKRFYSARGFLRCASCGCTLTADTQKGYQYYYCTNGKGNCVQHRKYLRSEKVDVLLADMFNVLKFDADFIELSARAYEHRNQDKAEYTKSSLETLVNELNSLSEKESLFADSFGSKVMSKALFEAKMKEIGNKRIEIKLQIKNIEEKGAVHAVTFEQIKNIFIDGNRAAEKYLQVDDAERKGMLEKLLSNALIENQTVAQYKFKSVFQVLANSPKNVTLNEMLRVRDSNPNTCLQRAMSYH